MSHLLRPARLALAALLALPLVSASGDDAQATPAYSWNLSRDMMVAPATNPDGAWTFMQSSNASPTAVGSYTNIPGPVVSSPSFDLWQGAMSAMIGVALANTTTSVTFTHGLPIAHPGNSSHVAVKWTNTTGIPLGIRILGRITHLDPNNPSLGDGVNYYVVRQTSTTSNLLTSGTVESSVDLDGRVVFANTGVMPNESVYFIIERRGNYFYDTSELDLFIAGAYDCTVPNPSPC